MENYSTDMSKSEDKQCAFCSNFLSKGEFHEEFDFFKHPAIKATLRELSKRLDSVGGDIEAWAIKRKLRSNRGVVMTGYGRLIEAGIWLRKLEDQDREISTNQEQATFSTSMPF